MVINQILSSTAQPLATQKINPQLNQGDRYITNEKFGDLLKNAVTEVNTSQVESDGMTSRLVAGEQVDLHEVMITAQKASITLQTALEVRNKAVEAYQEIMRMQV